MAAMLNLRRRDVGALGGVPGLVQGSTKFVIGAAVGAAGGFALGAFFATPTARSAGEAVVVGIVVSSRFIGRTTIRTAHGLGSILESGYTRVRGREAYLEHELNELREQITRLEQRMD